jgi:hypothetical protein
VKLGLSALLDDLLKFALKRHDGLFGRNSAPDDVVELKGHRPGCGTSGKRSGQAMPGKPEYGPHAGFSTIFQYESFRITFPSRNSQWSHPRTRTRTPSVIVPVSVHSETPILPLTQCRPSP